MTIRSKLKLRARLRSAIHRIRRPRPRPLILVYHRIADEPIDPWGLAVSPPQFKEHLEVLRRTRHPLPLMDFVRRLQAGTLPANAAAITFDDGYVDNLLAGKPLLTATDVPATVFLTTGYVDRSEPFWWDELSRLILLASGPQGFELAVGGRSLRFDFDGEVSAGQENEVSTSSSKTRRATLFELWQALRPLGYEERRTAMAQLRSIFTEQYPHAGLGRVMTTDEVRAIAAGGLVTIGAHTITHPVLSRLRTADCQHEVTESKRACEAIIGASVVTFAYPYGNFDAKTRDVVKNAGFALACSTRHGPIVATSDIFALPRVYAPNKDGDGFEQILRLASIGT